MNLVPFFALAVTIGPTPQVSPSPAASATPLVAPSSPPATPAPLETPPTPTPGTSLAPGASAGPVATTAPEAYKYRFVPRQPDAPAPGVPQIFAVYLNDRQLRSQGPIAIKVTTSLDVVKVVSESSGRAGDIPRVVPGDFEAASNLPKVPFIASGMTLYLEFVATGPTGVTTKVRVPVKLL